MSVFAALDPRVWLAAGLAVAVVGAGSYAAGRWQQRVIDGAEVSAAQEVARADAARVESNWQMAAKAAEEINDAELASVRSDLDVALQRLRTRPAARLSATATCASDGAGASGAQLSGPDAEFLARLASDADRVAADLRACQSFAEAVAGQK